LVIDDLHWADRSSALLLTHLARDLPGSRILVVAAYRDLEITGDSPAASELTRREQEIAGLVARGLTNCQIAEVLHITRNPRQRSGWKLSFARMCWTWFSAVLSSLVHAHGTGRSLHLSMKEPMAGTRSFTDAKEPPRIVGRELVEFALWGAIRRGSY
jgi:Bacterial regulatory proteins, luxR family